MDQLIERCEALDVHPDTVTACVRVPGESGKRHQEVETFQTTTHGLFALRDWLSAYQITDVGMEATGVYWKAPFYMLEAWRLRHNLRLVDALYVELGTQLDMAIVTTDSGMAEAGPNAELVAGGS